jgi:acetyl esterase/lipase
MKIQILFLASFILPLWFSFELNAADQFEKETVVYKEVGPLGIKADVYHYNDTRVRPVLVSLHGGALIMGHRENFSGPVKNFALTNGYVLVSFDYRLAPETKLPAIIEDIEDAFRWLRREGPNDFTSTRIALRSRAVRPAAISHWLPAGFNLVRACFWLISATAI